MLNIILADDHRIVRHGLKQIVLEEYKDACIFEAGNSNEVMRIARQQKVDVVVLDITMPTRDGIEVLKDLKREFPRLPVLMLSMHPEERFAVRAFKSGASGYLTKNGAPNELCDAIQKVLRGNKYITPTLAELLANSFGQTEEQSIDMLSDREYQVFIALASGKTVSETADDLALSVNTISTYRTRILEKMNVRTNADLTRYAFSHHLLD